MNKIFLVAAMMLTLGAAQLDAATTFRVTALRSGVGLYVSADTPKTALIVYFDKFGQVLPAWAAVITSARVCRSTHRIVGGAMTKFGYDSRTNYNGCP